MSFPERLWKETARVGKEVGNLPSGVWIVLNGLAFVLMLALWIGFHA